MYHRFRNRIHRRKIRTARIGPYPQWLKRIHTREHMEDFVKEHEVNPVPLKINKLT